MEPIVRGAKPLSEAIPRPSVGGRMIDAEELKKDIRYETFVFIRVTAAAVMKATSRIVS